MKKQLFIVLCILLLIIQLKKIDKVNPPITALKDFINIEKPNAEIAPLIRVACYDCHSNETTYPWYSNVAPISWWLKSHIDEGREHLNFSEWANYDSSEQTHIINECIELIEKGAMPLKSYTITHAEARLSKEQKEVLIHWFLKIKKDGK